MKKLIFSSLAACCMIFIASAAEDVAAKLPRLEGQQIQTTWNGPAVAAVQDGTYTIAAVLPKDTVHYAGFKINMTGDLAKQAIKFSISSTTAEKTRALYVRCYDRQNKCVASWKTWTAPISGKPQVLTFAAGHNSHGLEWEAPMVQSAGTVFAKIEFIIGHRGVAGTVYDARISNITMGAIPKTIPTSVISVPASLSSESFELLGIPAKSAELRSSIAFMANGRHYVLSRPQDHGKTGYLLLTDIESGKTEQYYNPKNVRQGDSFGSILASDGKFYYDQNSHVVVFDTKTRETRYLGKPDRSTSHFMVYTEAPDGTIYMGGTYTSTLVAYNPATGKFRNYGRLDPKEQYINQIATDKNGYVYCGIGTARANLVAVDPQTGKVTQIIPENLRKLGSGNAATGADGYAYLYFGNFRAKLLDGKVVATNVAIPAAKRILAPKYGGRIWDYEDGCRITGFDLYKKVITFQGLDGKKRDIPYDYVSGGLSFTSLGGDGKGKIFGSTNHPMHFVEYNSNTGKLIDHGPHQIVGGGNFCNMTYSKDGIVYLCEYAGGRLWKFDPAHAFDGNGPITPNLPGSPSIAEIHQQGKVNLGHFTLVTQRLLLCFGDQEGAKFTFPIKISKDGKAFLNILAFEHAIYGTATFEFQGVSRKVNLQNIIDKTKLVTLDLGEQKAGTYPLTITVNSHGGNSRPMIGLLGYSVTDTAAKLPKIKAGSNPKILGVWSQTVTRPRAVQIHPDGKHVVIAGYAGYGLCGGSFGIHNLATGKNTLLSDWLPGHSCITFRFAENGDIIGGTDVSAPGGGHVVATKPAIFRIDWKTRKVTAFTEFQNVHYVAAVELWNGKLYAALSNSQIVVADPQTMKIERIFAPNGLGTPVRNALLKSEDNRLFCLQWGGISEFHPETGDMVPRCRSTSGISTGGTIVNGHLYFACKVQYARWKIPAPLK